MNLENNAAQHHQLDARRAHHPNIFVWNVQGAGSREVLHVLREHIRMHKPSIVALVETRISGAKAQDVCNRVGFRNWFRVEAQGFQGGIWVFWNSDETDLVVLNSHDQFVTVEVKPQGLASWILTFNYASPQLHNRDILWPQLQQFASTVGKPWLLAGDFNETVSLEERNHGGPEMVRRCTRFKHWIENTGLIDLGFSGPKFTWARGLSPNTRKEARLDRALCNSEWQVRFQDGTVQHLLQACSDHSPLLIATGSRTHTTLPGKPFRFQAAWATHDQFEDVVKTNWNSPSPLMPKLTELALSMSKWNKEVFGNLFRRKRKIWARLAGVQRHIEGGAPRYLLKLERRLRRELDQTLDQIAMLWL